jgi:hypothetical protein
VYVVLSPTAQTVENGPSRSLEGFRHLIETVERDDGCSETTHMIAVVVLQVVDAPRREARGVLSFVIQGSSVTGTGQLASA